jgi:putative transposase
MTNIRRYFREGDFSFLSHVTHDRRQILLEHITLFHQAVKDVQGVLPFEFVAWVILPDHFHVLIDPKANSVSDIMKRIKLKFSGFYRSHNKLTSGRLWQYRFWDHVIRDQDDLNRHIDYIHYNPVKHGLVSDPFIYEESSIHRFIREGLYTRDWGSTDDPTERGDYGE